MVARTETESKGPLAGTEIEAFCPHCHQALNVFDAVTKQIWVRLQVSVDGRQGELLLSSRPEDFQRQVSVELGEQGVVDDVSCPHCGAPYPWKEKWDGWGFERSTWVDSSECFSR